MFAAIPVRAVRPNPLQPRQFFDEDSLVELARSIRSRGVLQPIIVRRGPGEEYTLIAGERRLRASELAGMSLVPAILRDDDLLEVALEENVQREDLTPLEEAEALAILAQDKGLSHAELAQVIHKSRPYVSNTLALTRLPDDVKREYFKDSRGISREILIGIARLGSPEEMRATWRRVRLQSMSVRSFRETSGGTAADAGSEAAATAIRASRRLGRALRALPDPRRLAGDEADALRRSLVRTQRRIEATIAALGGVGTSVRGGGKPRARAARAG
ncbi:MAG: ParB/RepB/Spo0J family partition protein [Alphaproteobacteria bacterium]